MLKVQNEILKPKVLDTCALLSLSVSGFLEKCLSFNILIPEEVKKELEDISQYPDQDGIHARRVLRLTPDKIKIVTIKNKSRIQHLLDISPNIDKGEAEVLVLAEEQKGIAITDDLRCLSALEENSNVPVYLSAYLFAGLILKNLATREDVLNAIDNIAKERDWKHSALYIYSKKYIEKI